MATVASLDVNLGVRSREFQREMRRAQRTVNNFGRSANAAFRNMALATAGAATALAALTRSTLVSTDEIAKAARNANLSSDSFQRLAESFRLGGSSANALVRGSQNLSRQIRDLGRGLSTQAAAFSRLGLTYRDLQDLAPEDQFLLVRQRLSEVTSATQRSAIAQQLFGRAGKEFGTILTENNAALLAQGQRLADLGGIIREDVLDSTELLVDQMETTGTVIRAQFTNALVGALGAAGDFSNLDGIIRGVGQATRVLTEGLISLITTIVEWRNTIGAVIVAWVALNAVMFAANAITAISTLVGALGTMLTALRGINLAMIAGRAATIGYYLVLLAIPIAIGALGVAIFSARDALQEGLAAAADYVAARFRIFTLGAENGLLAMRALFVRIGGAIQDFLIQRLNDAIDLTNNVLAFLGRDEIELISNEATANATQRLAEIEEQIMANVAAQNMLRDAAAGAATQVANSASAAVTAGIAGIAGVIDGARSALTGATAVATPGAGVPGEDPAEEAATGGEEAVASFWSRISASFDRQIETAVPALSDNLGMQLSQTVAAADFSNIGDVFVNTIQSNLQNRVQERLNEVFSEFFDGFFDLISSSLQGGGSGGGIGGLLSAGLGFFGFQDGGIVPGRPTASGRDNMLVAVSSGEAILNRQQQQALLEGGAGGRTINQTIQVTGDVTEATRRAVREMGNDITNQVQSGFQERGLLGG